MRKPYIRISHIFMEAVSFVFILASVLYVIIKASTIDGQIPTHYNMAGEIDGYGSPFSALILPLIMLSMVILFCLISHLVSPKYWNMPFKVKPQAAVVVYGDMVTMITVMGLLSGIYSLFEVILFMDSELSTLVISFVYVGLLVADAIVQLIRAKRHNDMFA